MKNQRKGLRKSLQTHNCHYISIYHPIFHYKLISLQSPIAADYQ